MIEQLLPDLYRMGIPLPNSPLKELNSYLIKGDGRFLIIDTGFNREECQKAMDSYLAELKVDLKQNRFLHYASSCRPSRTGVKAGIG